MTKTDELLREKIRKILTIDRGVVYGDFPGLIADLELLFNQEVEKRIAERMPSKIELVKEYPTGYAQLCLLFKWDFYKLSEFEKDILRQISDGNKKRVDVYEEVRSRLTCSEKPNNSQKTEGGAK